MNSLLIITPPALEPVTLTEAKAQLRVGDASDDALITSLITVARQVAEQILGRALMTQTLRLVCDNAPQTALSLPRAPIQSILHVKVYDDADNAQIVNAATYQLDSAGRLALRSFATWPTVSRTLNGFEVQYVAGYGALAADVPAPIKQGILAHIAHLYNHRGDEMGREGRSAGLYAVPAEALALYAPYRILPGVA